MQASRHRLELHIEVILQVVLMILLDLALKLLQLLQSFGCHLHLMVIVEIYFLLNLLLLLRDPHLDQHIVVLY
jgi:hypothetical protein